MGFFDMGRQIVQSSAMYDESITYQRRSSVVNNTKGNANDTALTLAAKVGKSHTVSSNIDGIVIHESWIDFIVDYAALNMMPEVGDIITFNGVRYVVGAPPDELCYRWHVLNQSLRIHAQKADQD